MIKLYNLVDIIWFKYFLNDSLISTPNIILANMAVFCSFVQPDFVRWLMSDGFVRQSKRALNGPLENRMIEKAHVVPM